MAKSRGKDAAKVTTPAPQKSRSPAPKVEAGKKKKNSKKPIITAPSPSKAQPEDDTAEDTGPGNGVIAEGDGEDTDEGSADWEDSEDEGIDREGMERLVELLGEDGLDDFDRAQLGGLGAEEDDGSGIGERQEELNNENEVSISEAGDKGEETSSGEDGETDGSAGADADEDAERDDIDDEDSIDVNIGPQQKPEVDNKVALERICQTIQLDPALPWTETLVLTYPDKIQVDVNDDLNRELAFYKQALHSAQTARSLAAKHNFPFTRPSDYFAEMVKSDAHMERIRQRLLNESATIKKTEEKRKEREGKKFGKQVQLEKLKERERSKKEMEERLKNLKRKRKDMLDNAQGNDGEDFDVAVEEAISERPSKRSKPSGSNATNKASRMPRHARDKKFGFGGAGRRSKQNTKESTDNFSSSGGRGKKGKGGANGRGGGQKRPGKSRRLAAHSKR